MKFFKIIRRLFSRQKKERLNKLAEKNYKTYKKWLRGHSPTYSSGKINLKRVRTSRAGNNYYVPEDLLQLTIERKDKIEEYQAALGYGMTKEELLETIEKCISINKDQAYAYNNRAVNAHRKANSSLQMELADIFARLKSINHADTILRIALLFFFVDHENPYTINSETQKRKYEEAQNDDDLRAFFLQTTNILLKESATKE